MIFKLVVVDFTCSGMDGFIPYRTDANAILVIIQRVCMTSPVVALIFM